MDADLRQNMESTHLIEDKYSLNKPWNATLANTPHALQPMT